jgi:hypothetical protein
MASVAANHQENGPANVAGQASMLRSMKSMPPRQDEPLRGDHRKHRNSTSICEYAHQGSGQLLAPGMEGLLYGQCRR